MKDHIARSRRINRNGENASRQPRPSSKAIIYPFFLIHMAGFGSSGFVMAYGDTPTPFLFLHGGFSIFIYTKFYLQFFGKEEVKWMFINAGLGILGIYAEISWLLERFFDKNVGDYPFYRHIIPFLYYVLYTFLIRQALLDLFRVRDDKNKARKVNVFYIAISLVVYLGIFLFTRKLL